MDENSCINEIYPVYFSYSGNKDGNSELEKPIEELRKLLSEANIDYRDYKVEGKTPFTYRRPMMESEEEIGSGHLIVVVLSISYIESSHCMYEWYNIVHNPDFEKRIFPIYLEDLRERLNDPVRTEMLDVILSKMYKEIALKEANSSVLSNEEKFILRLGNKAFKKELGEIIKYYRNNSVPKLERFDYEVLLKQIQDRIKELEPSTMDSQENPSSNVIVEKQFPNPPFRIPTQSNGHCLTSPPSDADSSTVIGREKDLEKLWEMLSEKKHVMLTGLGGIGKTKLAELLFHNYRDRFDEVAWIGYKGSLRQSFLYRIEDFRDRNDPWEAMMNDLHNDGKTKLFIIDNVDDDTDQRPLSDKDLRNLTGWENTAILLTSRLKEDLRPYSRYELKALDKDDCIAVFNHYYGSEADPEWVGKIVALAHYHTFTIELLAKGAKRENLAAYYKKIKKGFDEFEREVHSDYDDENATIEWHLRCLFDIQKRPEADKKVLNSFAVLPANCECSLEEIGQWFGFENKDLDDLIQDGWLSYDEGKQAFSIHPLVRAIVRFDFADDAQGHKKTIAPEGTTAKILDYFENHDKLFRIDKGFVSLQRMIGILESVMCSIVQEETKRIAALYNHLGFSYHEIGNYEKALKYFSKALAIRKKVFGKEHPSTATSFHNIGLVYREQGDYDKALKYFSKALAIRKKVLGEEHPDTAMSYNNIGVVNLRQSNYDKALKYFSKALVTRKKVLGEEHPDTAMSYNNIGVVNVIRGDHDMGLKYYFKALKIRKKVFGIEHRDTAQSYNNIGIVFRKQGEYDKALKKFFFKALEIREKVLGIVHPDTATSYNEIGVVYREQGEYDKALCYFFKALKIREMVLGKEHPATAASIHNIGMVHRERGDYSKALEYFSKALTISEKVLGKEHFDTATTYYEIGVVYREQGNCDKALEYFKKTYLIYEKIFGPKHQYTENALVAIRTVEFLMNKK